MRLFKTRSADERAPNLVDYDAERAAFSWAAERAELCGLHDDCGLNIAYAAVDRHAEGPNADRIALRWLGRDGAREDYSYARLAEQSSRFANVLAALGVLPGERVFVLAGRIPELYVAALGTLKRQAVFSPLFETFGPEPIRLRMALAAARVLVTTQRLYEHKIVHLRDTLPSLDYVLLVGDDRRPTSVLGTLDFGWLMAAASPRWTIEATRPETPALLHFTSGTTGTPKGALHVHDAVVMHHVTGLTSTSSAGTAPSSASRSTSGIRRRRSSGGSRRRASSPCAAIGFRICAFSRASVSRSTGRACSGASRRSGARSTTTGGRRRPAASPSRTSRRWRCDPARWGARCPASRPRSCGEAQVGTSSRSASPTCRASSRFAPAGRRCSAGTGTRPSGTRRASRTAGTSRTVEQSPGSTVKGRDGVELRL